MKQKKGFTPNEKQGNGNADLEGGEAKGDKRGRERRLAVVAQKKGFL